LELSVEYRRGFTAECLSPDVLAVIGFGSHASLPDDPRCIRVPLEPLHGADTVEIWRGLGEVKAHVEPQARCMLSTDYAFGVVELDEREFGDIRSAAAAAYALIRKLQENSAHPHLLRIWNYLDAINHGSGDDERYKQFCLGRARTFGAGWSDTAYPAATAVGRPAATPQGLQIFWIAGRQPGEMLENPRQVSAFHYPRQYGPAAPSFSRAVLLREARLLMVSGTASIVGHASLHVGNLLAQCKETLANLRSVLQRAQNTGFPLDRDFGERSLLKVYLREAGAAAEVAAFLEKNLAATTPYLILQADICRQDLLVEMDCTHGGSRTAQRPAIRMA